MYETLFCVAKRKVNNDINFISKISKKYLINATEEEAEGRNHNNQCWEATCDLCTCTQKAISEECGVNVLAAERLHAALKFPFSFQKPF